MSTTTTAWEIITNKSLVDEDAIEKVLEGNMLNDAILNEFICQCADYALSLIDSPDPRSVAGVNAKKQLMRGEISDETAWKARKAAEKAFEKAVHLSWWQRLLQVKHTAEDGVRITVALAAQYAAMDTSGTDLGRVAARIARVTANAARLAAEVAERNAKNAQPEGLASNTVNRTVLKSAQDKERKKQRELMKRLIRNM